MAIFDRLFLMGSGAAVALAAVAVASCTSSSGSPQQVRASNPTVTYEYGSDEELLQAQQEAVVFCSQYGAAPQPARITRGSGGGNAVLFECDPNLPTTAPPEVSGSDLAYSYRSDQELLEASRNAHTYCTDNGWQRAVPNVSTNTDGSRTVVFQCA